MADDGRMPPPVRLVNFVSEEQLEESRRTRGARVEDGTAQRDRPLYEIFLNIRTLVIKFIASSLSVNQILKENKDKKDAEFNERFKHRPPKALDEDESEFLDKLEMSRREYEQKVADEEAQELQRFQAAVAAQGSNVLELKETTPPVPKLKDEKSTRRKNPPLNPLGMVIKVKPQAKKAKTVHASSENIPCSESLDGDGVGSLDSVIANTKVSLCSAKTDDGDDDYQSHFPKSSLVSYSDESEDDS